MLNRSGVPAMLYMIGEGGTGGGVVIRVLRGDMGTAWEEAENWDEEGGGRWLRLDTTKRQETKYSEIDVCRGGTVRITAVLFIIKGRGEYRRRDWAGRFQ